MSVLHRKYQLFSYTNPTTRILHPIVTGYSFFNTIMSHVARLGEYQVLTGYSFLNTIMSHVVRLGMNFSHLNVFFRLTLLTRYATIIIHTT